MKNIQDEIGKLYYKIAIIDRKYKKLSLESNPRDNAININNLICKGDFPSSEFSFEPVYFSRIVSKTDFVLLYNFEILFRPECRFDLMSFIKEKSKSRKFAIIWPGEILNEQLIYSRPSRPDYYTHRIDNYLVYKEKV